MWTLYGAPGSGSAAVELALEQAGRPYRVVRAASWEDRAELAELRRANPLVQIPTLQMDDGSVLTETAAILIHRGLLDPPSGLLPEPAPFLGGAAPGALDAMAAAVSRWSGARAHLRTARPRLSDTFQRLEAHPRAAPVFARHWPR